MSDDVMELEIRDPDDETVIRIRDVVIHLERMDRDSVWIGITDVKTKEHVAFDLWTGSKCRHKINMRVRDERDAAVKEALRSLECPLHAWK